MQRKPKVPRLSDSRSGEAGLDNVEFLAEYEDIVKTFAQDKRKNASTPTQAAPIMAGKNKDRDRVLSSLKKRKVRFADPKRGQSREPGPRPPSLSVRKGTNANFNMTRKENLNLAALKNKYKIKKLKIHLDRKEVNEILQSLKKQEPPKTVPQKLPPKLPQKPLQKLPPKPLQKLPPKPLQKPAPKPLQKPPRSVVVVEKVKVKAEPRQVSENPEPQQISKNMVPDSPPQVKPIFYDCPSPFIKLKKEKENETVTSNRSQRKNIEVEKKLATIKKTVKKVFETSDNLKSVLKSIASFPSPEKSAEKRKLTPESQQSPPSFLDNQWIQQEEVPTLKPIVSQFSAKETTRRIPKDNVVQKLSFHTDKSPEPKRTSITGTTNRSFSLKTNDYLSELKPVHPRENTKFISQKSQLIVPIEKPAAPKVKPMVDVSVQAYPSYAETDTQTCIYELTSQKVLNPALGMLPVDAILSKCERLIRIKVFDEVKNKILNMSHKYYKDPRCDNQYLQRKRSFQCDKVTALHIYSFLEEYLAKDLNESEEDSERHQSPDANSSKLTLNNVSSDQTMMRTIATASNGEDHTYTLPPSVVSKSFGAIKTVSLTSPLKVQMCSNISLQKASQKLKSVTNCVVRNKPSTEVERKQNMNMKVHTARTPGFYSVNNMSIEEPTHKMTTAKLGPLPNFASIKHNRAAMSSTPEMTE